MVESLASFSFTATHRPQLGMGNEIFLASGGRQGLKSRAMRHRNPPLDGGSAMVSPSMVILNNSVAQ